MALSFKVVSRGLYGAELIELLEGQGFVLAPDTRATLRSPRFQPTKNIVRRIAVLEGERVRASADELVRENKLLQPDLETQCLICLHATPKWLSEHNLAWLVGYEYKKPPINFANLKDADRDSLGYRMAAYCENTGRVWFPRGGLAFVDPFPYK